MLEAVRLTKSWRALESVPTAGVMGVMGPRRDGAARRIVQIVFGCPSMTRLRMTVNVVQMRPVDRRDPHQP